MAGEQRVGLSLRLLFGLHLLVRSMSVAPSGQLGRGGLGGKGKPLTGRDSAMGVVDAGASGGGLTQLGLLLSLSAPTRTPAAPPRPAASRLECQWESAPRSPVDP